MANYQYAADILDDVLFRAGEATDGTSEFHTAALRYINRAYQAVWQGGSELDPSIREDWLWLRSTATLTLNPKITTGTVSVTNNSTAVTFSSAPSSSVADYFFQVTNQPDVFRISTHTAASTSATLDSVYTSDTASAASYTLFPLVYDLPADFWQFAEPLWIRSKGVGFPWHPGHLDVIEPRRLKEYWPIDRMVMGIPTVASLVASRKVQFNKYPEKLCRVEVEYLAVPVDLTDSTSQEPVVPATYRRVIADAALFFLLMDKNDNRADGAGLIARNGLQGMARENRGKRAAMSDLAGTITARLDRVTGSPVAPHRTRFVVETG